MYLMDEEEEQDFEIHDRSIIDVLFALEENAHYELDFSIEKQIQCLPRNEDILIRKSN